MPISSLTKGFAGVLLAASLSLAATFPKCGFNIGVDLAQASTKKCGYMGCTTKVTDLDLPSGVDFVAKFSGYTDVGSGHVAPAPAAMQEGTFLDMAKTLNATPVWYTYIIAEGAKVALGLVDCNMGSSKTLCTDGAAYIRANEATILNQYKAYAQYAASKWGASAPMVWALEPDFYQYASSANGNGSPLSYTEAAALLTKIVSTIKTAMPNALISMDISPWAPDAWFSALPLNLFDMMNTSGGISQPGSAVSSSNPMTWAHIHTLTGKPILADDGYGTGGGLTSPNSGWSNASNITARMNDGVVGLMEAYPTSSWTSTVTSIHNQTAGSCGTTSVPKYTLTFKSSTGGSISGATSGASYDSGTAVTLRATPQTGYRFAGWSGAASGLVDSVRIVMTANKSCSASFSQPPKYTLSLTAGTGGSITSSPAGPTYDSGTVVTLRATAQTGYRFAGWSGSQTSSVDSLRVVMTANQSYTASFTLRPKYVLTFSASTGGSIGGATSGASYDSGTAVTLRATPQTGYRFAGWSGAASGLVDTVRIVMTSSKACSATFTQPPKYTLTVTAGAGGSVSANPAGPTYDSGAVVTLRATAQTGYRFAGWTGSQTSSVDSLRVVMTSNQSYTASFTLRPKYVLTFFATTGGSIGGATSGTSYDSGAVVTLRATAQTGYRFAGWKGAATGFADSVRIVMTASKACTATFSQPPKYTLTATAGAGGSVSVNPAGPTYDSGAVVTLRATAQTGYRFLGWTGSVVSSASDSLRIRMDSSMQIAANFSRTVGVADRLFRREGAWIAGGRLFVNFDLPGTVDLALVSVEGRTVLHLGSGLRANGLELALPTLPAGAVYLRVRGAGTERIVPLSGAIR